MREDVSGGSGRGRSTQAQAGKSLCVSETIFPQASRHSVKMVCDGAVNGARPKGVQRNKVLGGEFVDLRGLDGVAPGTAPVAG